MKKILRRAALGIGLFFIFLSAAACGDTPGSENSDGVSFSSESAAKPLSEVAPISYEGVASLSDMDAYAA